MHKHPSSDSIQMHFHDHTFVIYINRYHISNWRTTSPENVITRYELYNRIWISHYKNISKASCITTKDKQKYIKQN